MHKPSTQAQRVAVIGGGWAGCACATKLAQAGKEVHWFEASRHWGGRARSVEVNGLVLDNGQHLLLGAYRDCFTLMKRVGVEAKSAFLDLPLQMIYPAGQGIHFLAPRLPAPWHVLIALLRAQGLNRADKLALARLSTTARWMDWQLDQDCSVNDLLLRFDQTPNLIRWLWRPLCLAALNTTPENASANIFLAVLRDSLGAHRRASDMLIPRLDLSELLPLACARFVEHQQGRVYLHHRVSTIQHRSTNDHPSQSKWHLKFAADENTSNLEFDAVIIATDAAQASQLLQTVGLPRFDTAFEYESITTVYLQYEKTLKLDRPFFALEDDDTQGHWGQFVFDRGQLQSQHAGLLAVVVSASHKACEQGHDLLAPQITQQLAQQLQLAALATPLWHKVISEKRATFRCSPHLQRPEVSTSFPTLMIAGDYTASDYPATLEAAVRSGHAAAKAILDIHK